MVLHLWFTCPPAIHGSASSGIRSSSKPSGAYADVFAVAPMQRGSVSSQCWGLRPSSVVRPPRTRRVRSSSAVTTAKPKPATSSPSSLIRRPAARVRARRHSTGSVAPAECGLPRRLRRSQAPGGGGRDRSPAHPPEDQACARFQRAPRRRARLRGLPSRDSRCRCRAPRRNADPAPARLAGTRSGAPPVRATTTGARRHPSSDRRALIRGGRRVRDL